MLNVDKAFFKEEIRSGYLVTEKRKKVWAVELEILEQFDAVCRKYNLRYFADYGTLLGAVRHKGFIPWDDDIDVTMFRDDYEKLQQIAHKEFKPPLFFQNGYSGTTICAFSKIRDSRTSAIEFPDADISFNQGIFIDIFPLDDAPDGSVEKFYIKRMQEELWASVIAPQMILDYLDHPYAGQKFVLETDTLKELMDVPYQQRYKEFEAFNLSCFGQSDNVCFITDEICDLHPSVKKAWYNDIVYLPFETLLLPAPAEYHKILTTHYGNYHEFVYNSSAHEGIIMEPDIPYAEYLRNKRNENR